MIASLFIPYLLLLLSLPVLAQWRWGFAGGIVSTVIELALVALAFYLLDLYHLFPKPLEGEPPSHPEARSRWDQSVGAMLFYIWLIAPACVALAGGALALGTGVLRVIWRQVAARWRARPAHGPE